MPKPRTILTTLGHLGLWAGLYSLAALFWLVQLAGLPLPSPALALSVLLTATGAYALDRVKLKSAWIDPADLDAQPRRYAFLVPRARAVRTAAIAALTLGALLGLFISPYAPIAAALAAAGVIVYAARPRTRRARPKDITWLKNVYVGLGITGFVTLAALADAHTHGTPITLASLTDARSLPLLASASLLLLRIIIDAALCDIDDEPADRRHGTGTLSTWLGARRAWVYTGLARGTLIALVLCATPCPLRARLTWAAAMVIGTLALRLRRPEKIRDPVDIRFAIEAAAATLALLP